MQIVSKAFTPIRWQASRLIRRIPFGLGYRVHFGQDGSRLVALLRGGTKKRRSNGIEQAKRHWDDCKSRKRKGD